MCRYEPERLIQKSYEAVIGGLGDWVRLRLHSLMR